MAGLEKTKSIRQSIKVLAPDIEPVTGIDEKKAAFYSAQTGMPIKSHLEYETAKAKYFEKNSIHPGNSITQTAMNIDADPRAISALKHAEPAEIQKRIDAIDPRRKLEKLEDEIATICANAKGALPGISADLLLIKNQYERLLQRLLRYPDVDLLSALLNCIQFDGESQGTLRSGLGSLITNGSVGAISVGIAHAYDYKGSQKARITNVDYSRFENTSEVADEFETSLAENNGMSAAELAEKEMECSPPGVTVITTRATRTMPEKMRAKVVGADTAKLLNVI